MEICCEGWEVTPLASPRLIRHCPGCNDTRPFVCAETFRVNAQKKTLDVWLNYRCERCSAVWKCPIFERKPVARMSPRQLEAFFRNDSAMARRFAFDVAHLRRHCARIETISDVRVRRLTVTPAVDDVAPLCIRLYVPLTCGMRLDRLLAGELNLSRLTLQKLRERGDLHVSPGRDHALRLPIHDGQRIWVGAQQLAN